MASILKVDTIQDQSGNNIINENADTITIGASGDTITVPTGATISGALANTPSFHVLKDAAQSVADSTSTVMTWQTESWDTNNAFASNKFTVPSGEGGKYFIYASLVIDGIADGKVLYAQIRKNGSILLTVQIHTGSSGSVSSFVSGQIELAATDYVEISALHNHGSARDIREGTNPGSFFGGFKIIGA
jgi:hypothetical protein